VCTPLLKLDLILIVADAIYAASSIPFIEASIRFCGAGANTDDVRLLRSHFIFLLKGTSYMAFAFIEASVRLVMSNTIYPNTIAILRPRVQYTTIHPASRFFN
jgi:hypothetical protein